MPLHPAAWIARRAGLGPAFDRLARGSAPIAYLGLSVTAQRDGYRPLLHDALVARTGHPHVPINAGVGGVGSVSLAFLMDRLVTPHAPSLCFVECTTGDIDGRTEPDDVPRAIEGILRKLSDIRCQACLLHLYQREQSWQVEHPVLLEYERVASHYGVPSIHVGRRLEDEIRNGRADADLLFRDVVHTTPAGARVTTDLIVEGLDWIRGHQDAPTAAPPHTMRPPCTDGGYERAVMDEATPLHCASPPTTGRFRLQYSYVEVDTGNAIHYRNPGAALKGLCVIVGPASGVIRISTPDGDCEYQLLDKWCEYDRLSTVVFNRALPADAPVTIRPVSTSTSLRVIGFLSLPQ